MNKTHARLSPSSASRWTSCTASPAAQDDTPNDSSDASRIGTTCHQIQEELLWLLPEKTAQDYVGRTLNFYADGRETWADATPATRAPIAQVTVTEDMAGAVHAAVAYIREQHALLGGELLVEQRVPIGQFTGETDAHGSADVILLGATWIAVFDSKFGRKRVDAARVVHPERVDFITGERKPELRGPNLQMACYALGAMQAHDMFGTIEQVTMTIVQPFIDHVDSYSCSVAELRTVEDFLRTKAEETRSAPKFVPNFENCFFCRAKGLCNAQTNRALGAVFDGFGEADCGVVNPPNPLTLGSQYALLPFVTQWAADVADATRKALANGDPVVRNDGQAYKLVTGRPGNRTWTDEDAAAEVLVRARLRREDMYVFKLITPTMAEKMATPKKPKKGQQPEPAAIPPSKWQELRALIDRADGQPVIALASDPRPAFCKAEGFSDTSATDTSPAALFGE